MSDGKKAFMLGNEAMVEGAIAAGCRFYAGYPITPSSEIAERFSWRMLEVGGVFIQMEDELSSVSAIVGASLAGKKALTATSGPGFCLMQENIGCATMMEVPCVIVDVQRPGPSGGRPSGTGTRGFPGRVLPAGPDTATGLPAADVGGSGPRPPRR